MTFINSYLIIDMMKLSLIVYDYKLKDGSYMKKKIITVLLALLVGGLVVTTLASCAGDKVPSNPPAIANL